MKLFVAETHGVIERSIKVMSGGKLLVTNL